LRWNLWDVLLNPTGILIHTIKMFIHPFQYTTAYSVNIVATSFIGLSYMSLKPINESKDNKL